VASLSRVNVQVGFQGQEALAGMQKLEAEAKKLETASESLSGAGVPQANGGGTEGMERGAKAANKEGRSLVGTWTEFKSQLDLAVGAAKGIYTLTSSFLEMGAALESSQIRMAYLSGSWEEAGKSLDQLRNLSVDSGIAFSELTAGMQKLANSGLSIQTATGLMERFARGAEIMGQGGAEAMAGATRELLRGAVASEGALAQLQEKGLDVYGSLGDELEKLTGKSYTTEEALRAIRRGAISSATAMEAITAAADSPKAMQAQARFLGSFEGQMSRLKTTWEELTRTMSQMLLKSFDFTAIAAGARGVFSAVLDIVKKISEIFLPVIDPKDKAAGIEKTFRALRDATFAIAERIGKAVVELSATMEGVFAVVQAEMNKLMKRLEWGVAGIFAGDEIERFNESEDKIAKARIARANRNKEKDLAGIEAFFKGLNADAKAKDIARDAELAAAAQGKGADAAEKAAEAAKKQRQQMELAAKSFEQLALDLESQFATPIEQFNRSIEDANTKLLAAQKNNLLKPEMLGRVEAGLQRQVGQDIMELIKNNATGTNWQAARAERGSASAAEAILRNRFGDESKNIQQRIKDALDRANMLAKAQLDAQREAVKAFQNAKPGVIAFN